MTRHRNVRGVVRLALIAMALAVPTLSLIPLGGVLLWQKGWLLPWAVCALAVVAIVSFMEVRLLDRAARAPQSDLADIDPGGMASAGWTVRERQAWSDVVALSRRIDTDKLVDTQAFMDLATCTIGAVAKRLHAGKADPVWQFTMPEALAICERVSRRLAEFVDTHVPFGDMLTLAQLRTAYRWRGAVDVAERAYDVWRVLRLANPATAATHEARDRLSRALLAWGRDQVTLKLAQSFVEEVGRAAIDLYGGRLRSASPSRLAGREDHIAAVVDAFPYRITIVADAVDAADRESLRSAIATLLPRAISDRRLLVEDITAPEAAATQDRSVTPDILVWLGNASTGRAGAARFLAYLSRTSESRGPFPVVLPAIILPSGTSLSRAIAEIDALLASARPQLHDRGVTVLPPYAAATGAVQPAKELDISITSALDAARSRRVSAIIGYDDGAPTPGGARRAAAAAFRAARSVFSRGKGRSP